MGSVRTELKRQKTSNRNTLPYYRAFQPHRERLTQLLAERGDGSNTVCVLGAGNCYDLDLVRVCERYARVHLVDMDPDAVSKARMRQPTEVRGRITTQAPIDLSGSNDRLANWRDMKVTPEELIALPSEVADSLAAKLSGPFDVVVSACLLSQLLLTLRRVLTERHPLFEAATLTLVVAHLRTLERLTAKSGRALFVTDVSSDEIAPLGGLTSDVDPLAFLRQLVAQGKVFNALEPGHVRSLAAADPVLARRVSLSAPLGAWTWRNGPTRTFLVYASELRRNEDP